MENAEQFRPYSARRANNSNHFDGSDSREPPSSLAIIQTLAKLVPVSGCRGRP